MSFFQPGRSLISWDSSDEWANKALESHVEEILARPGWNKGEGDPEPPAYSRKFHSLPAIEEGPSLHSSEEAWALEESSLDPDGDHTHLRGPIGAILRTSRADLMAKYHPDIPSAQNGL